LINTIKEIGPKNRNLNNGSLNAAMESGRLAAEGLKEKRQGIFA